MKFAVQIRVDHASKPGGDTALAKAFAGRLRSAGHEATLIADISAISSLRPDVLLAFNLDQPLELLSMCRAARSAGCRVAVYALHHPDAGVKTYLSGQLEGARGLVARMVGGEPASYFHAMAMLRGLLRRNRLTLTYLFKSRSRLLADTAALIDNLLVSGPSEEYEIRATMPSLSNVQAWHVPHPVDIDPLPELKLEAQKVRCGRLFFTGGRIESRKNQLAVLDVAKRFPEDEFVFAGLVNETDPAYASAFAKRLEASPNCRWVGQLDMSGLLSHIANADAVLSPSWFEVMSLINLFAFALGTPVISAAHTYDSDLLGPGVLRFLPERPNDLARVLNEFVPLPKKESNVIELQKRAAAFAADTWKGFDDWLRQVEIEHGVKQ